MDRGVALGVLAFARDEDVLGAADQLLERLAGALPVLLLDAVLGGVEALA